MVFIYVIKLEKNKYYIGKTKNPKFRLKTHFNQNGSMWTKKYKPLEIVELISNCDDYDEDKITMKYMDKYGIDNVRGGSFVSLKLNKASLDTLKQMSNSINNRCFNCGNLGHYSNTCPLDNYEEYIKEESEEEEEEEVWGCSYCGKEFNSYKGCMFHENVHCKKKYDEYSEEDEDSEYTYKYQNSKKTNKSSTCFRCGRKGHYSSNCYAAKHIKGYYLY